MDVARKQKVVLINRYYPPNKSVTGASAFELAQFLKGKEKLEVSTVSIQAKYKGNKAKKEGLENAHYLQAIYQGQNKILRFIFNFLEGYQLVKKAISLKADVIITLTDPPLLNYWAARLLKRKKHIRWFNWTMDLYPNAFVSAGLVSSTNFIYRRLENEIKTTTPDLTIALGNQQKAFLAKNYYGTEFKTALLPCGIHEEKGTIEKPFWYVEDKIIFAYAGNLGEAHSETFILNFINLLDPQKHLLILSTYGSKSKAVIEKASKKKESVVLLDNLNKKDFGYIDSHLVSLLPKWTNICVPSKAVSAVCAHSTIVFYGAEDADTKTMLDEACFFIPYTSSKEEEKKRIAKTLDDLDRNVLQQKKKAAVKISADLLKLKRETFEFIAEEILEETIEVRP